VVDGSIGDVNSFVRLSFAAADSSRATCILCWRIPSEVPPDAETMYNRTGDTSASEASRRGSSYRHLDFLENRRRFRNLHAISSNSFDMKLDRLLDQLFDFFQGFSRSDTARQVGYIRAVTRRPFLNNHDVLHASSFRSPACFRMFFSVPVGTSTPGLPAIVTCPGF